VSNVPLEMRASRKLLRAVAELHLRGYQRLRVFVSQYELGTWRCSIAPAVWMSGDHGALLADTVDYGRLANYSSADEHSYWGWTDLNNCSPSRLAEIFLDRFDDLARLGFGQDWSYVGWFQHMLYLTYPDALPVTYSPYARPMTEFLGTIGRSQLIPLPPPGHGAASSGQDR
jgi:hypothetical protein